MGKWVYHGKEALNLNDCLGGRRSTTRVNWWPTTGPETTWPTALRRQPTTTGWSESPTGKPPTGVMWCATEIWMF